MGGGESKEAESAPPPQSDVKFKNEKQAKVFTALSAIHQNRNTHLAVKIRHPSGKYAKKDVKIYTWHGRPQGYSVDDENDDRVFKDAVVESKTKGNSKVELEITYGHSLIDFVLFQDLEATGFDSFCYSWFKPSTWVDELKIDADIRLFECVWTLPYSVPTDNKGKKVKGGKASPDMCIAISYPSDYVAGLFKVAFEGQTTELQIEKNSKDLSFFQGVVDVVKPGEIVLTIQTKKFMLALGYDETDEPNVLDLQDYPIKVTFELAPPEGVINDVMDNSKPKRYDKPLVKEDFKELLLWQRPLPRTFVPDIKNIVLVKCEVERCVSCKKGVWSCIPASQVIKPKEAEPGQSQGQGQAGEAGAAPPAYDS